MLICETLFFFENTLKNKPANSIPILKKKAPTTTDSSDGKAYSREQYCIASDDASIIEFNAREVIGFSIGVRYRYAVLT